MKPRHYTPIIFLLLTVVFFALTLTLQAFDNEVERVSVSSAGVQGNNDSISPAISADGRYIVFNSDASNLVADDTNNASDVFVYDRDTQTTERISVSSSGQQGALSSYNTPGSISADGRFVVFHSSANTLVSGDTNGNTYDVFVRDRQLGETTRVSVSSSGEQANDGSGNATISADGRYIVFGSYASNLVAGDANGSTADIFVHDRQTAATSLVSVSSAEIQGNGASNWQQFSADGHYVAFQSYATNLIADDTNGASDIFVRDLQAGETWRVSISAAGTQGNSFSFAPFISSDGRYVAFTSLSTNLVPDDTNGFDDAFVHDNQTNETFLVSLSSSGTQGNNISEPASVSADGRFVIINSYASNLVADDTNGTSDVFIHDRQTGETLRVSESGLEAEGNGLSNQGSLSDDGAFVVFRSFANNLVANDTNSHWDIFVALNPFPVLYPPTATPSPTPTDTATNTATYTPSATNTPTDTPSPTPSDTPTPSHTPTATDTPTNTPMAVDAAPVRNFYDSLPIKLTWTQVTVAIAYEIQVDSDPNFGSVPPDYSAILPGTSLEAEINTLDDGLYYWRVRRQDTNGDWGLWSKTERFTLDTS